MAVGVTRHGTGGAVNAVRRGRRPALRFAGSAEFEPRAEVRVPGGGSWVKAGADAQITDLTVDDHAFLTFGEPEELFDLTAAFVRAGRVCGRAEGGVGEGGETAAELTRRGIAAGRASARVRADAGGRFPGAAAVGAGVRREPGDGRDAFGARVPCCYFLRRRLPPCQSSSWPAWSGGTPKLASWGRSRRLRFSSAKPGNPARPMT